MTTKTNNTTHLILGGTRSGKSRFAEKTVLTQVQNSTHSAKFAHYVATAEALDDEMCARIQRHQTDRYVTEQNATIPFKWNVIEEPIKLADTLNQFSSNDTVLVECLTLWLSNCLHHQCWEKQKQALLTTIKETDANIVMVSNETGQGIVPMNALSRDFIDEAGWLHQELAELCQHVSFVTAGIAQQLK